MAYSNIEESVITEKNIQKAIQQIQKDLLKAVKNNQEDCDVLRLTMDKLIVYLEYDPIFIVGKNGKYYQEGMHQYFIKAPQPLKIDVPRNPMAAQLEVTHIDLYHCDKKLFIQIERYEQLKNYLATQLQEELVLGLNAEYNNLSESSRPKTQRKKREWVQDKLFQWSTMPILPKTPQLYSDKRLITSYLQKNKGEDRKQSTPSKNKVQNFNTTIYKHLKISPNPNQGRFSIDIAFEKTMDIQLQIVNSVGQLILTKALNNQSHYLESIQLNNIASGIYFVKIKMDGDSQQRTMIVE